MSKLQQCLLMICCAGGASGLYAQQRTPTPLPQKRPAATPTPTKSTKPAATTTAPVGKTVTPPAAETKPEVTADQLLTQGKTFFKAGKYDQAMAKFEAALKLEPERDEALGLAADLAYRLDDQEKARTWFLRRAELANQKDSIRAYCFYRAALSYWRDAHDEIATNGNYQNGLTLYKLPEKSQTTAEEQITSGLYYADRALSITRQYADAYTLKSLLHSEWELITGEEKKKTEHHQLALKELRQALSLTKDKDTKTLTADFGMPTVLVGEFAPTKADDTKATENPDTIVQGGEVVTRAAAIFPAVGAARQPDADATAATGVTKDGGAYSIGSGRGALTAAYTPGKVKVEVLISVTGEVVFAHVVQGRSDLNGAAVIAARKWKFTPATFEGKPVQLSGVITFDMKPGRATPTPTPSQPTKP